MTLTDYELTRWINRWEVPDAPHCSNCVFAKVSGRPENPDVSCAAGHGKLIELATLVRPSHPRQFRVAARCPDFSDMGPAPISQHAG
jgi:hypothetical protein